MSLEHAPRRVTRARRLQDAISAILERLTVAFVAALAAALVFAYVALEMSEGETLKFDTYAVLFLHHHRAALLYSFLTAISWLGGTGPQTALVVLAVTGFWRAGRFRTEGVSLLIAGIGGVGLILGLKDLFHRARPAPNLAHLGYSFPSGHSFFALTIYGMLAYLLTRHAAPPRRRLIWAVAAAAILLVGFSRVYLGVHYPSDVIGGYLLALPWLWGCLALPTWLRWGGG